MASLHSPSRSAKQAHGILYKSLFMGHASKSAKEVVRPHAASPLRHNTAPTFSSLRSPSIYYKPSLSLRTSQHQWPLAQRQVLTVNVSTAVTGPTSQNSSSCGRGSNTTTTCNMSTSHSHGGLPQPH